MMPAAYRGAAAAAVLLSAALLVTLAGPALALPPGMRARTYKGGLDFPVDMEWVKGTRKIFYTEKNTGKVRVLVRKRLKRRACVNLDVSSEREQGALGIALHPRYERNHFLYVYWTSATPRENRVTRFKVVRNRCRRRKRIVGGIPATSGIHNGGQLEFVKGKLFVSVGEDGRPSEAQDRSSRLGKILRLNPNGSVPRRNPFGRRNPVWSFGHRNPFGLAHRPGTRRLYETENGPQCDDELNKIVRGRNYGWGPGYSCGTAGVGNHPKPPLWRWTTPLVPTDPTWYSGRLKRLSGSLYVGDFGNGRLHRFKLNRRGTRVRRHRVVFNSADGIVDVAKGPHKLLYFLTPSRIMRIVRR